MFHIQAVTKFKKMNTITQQAKENYMGGLSCAEAVVKTAMDTGFIERSDEVLKISSALKAGIGQKRDVCGAFMGAVLALGVKYGRIKKDDDIDTVNQKVGERYEKFKEKFGHMRCRNLIKDFIEQDACNTPPQKEHCSEIVAWVVEELSKE